MSFASHGFGYHCVHARRRALLALGILLATNLFATADDLVGQASIIDGDTLEIHGKRIRLWGIDAPLRRAVALSGVHSGRRPSFRMLERCQRASLRAVTSLFLTSWDYGSCLLRQGLRFRRRCRGPEF